MCNGEENKDGKRNRVLSLCHVVLTCRCVLVHETQRNATEKGNGIEHSGQVMCFERIRKMQGNVKMEFKHRVSSRVLVCEMQRKWNGRGKMESSSRVGLHACS